MTDMANELLECGAEHVVGGVPACDARATAALMTDKPVPYGLSAALGPSNRFNACDKHVEAMSAVLAAKQNGVAPRRVKL